MELDQFVTPFMKGTQCQMKALAGDNYWHLGDFKHAMSIVDIKSISSGVSDAENLATPCRAKEPTGCLSWKAAPT
ncbi:Hypothetical protein D9617_65g035070 [Elsinoe fawcettii]|nr:Hypothetical protein D9617_65g035070 [Elsinoe fawcettii]